MNNSLKGLLRALPEGFKAGWKRDKTSGHVLFENPAIGILELGTVPAGTHDQPLLHVRSGSPIMGYWFDEEGLLYVLALVAKRFNLKDGAPLPEVPGGFSEVDPKTGKKESPKKGALRELVEETGLKLEDAQFTGGEPFVSDRALFGQLVSDGNNVFMVELRAVDVAYIHSHANLELMYWTDFTFQTVDGISAASVGRLTAGLEKAGIIEPLRRARRQAA